jgi:hypothetical protein
MISDIKNLGKLSIFGAVYMAFFFLAFPFLTNAFTVSNIVISGNNPYSISFETSGYIGSGTEIAIGTTEATPDYDWLQSCDGVILSDVLPYDICKKTGTNGIFTFNFTVKNGYSIYDLFAEISTGNDINEWYSFSDFDSSFILFGNGDFSGTVHFNGNNFQSNNNIWVGGNGFWGSTTPSSILTTMSASVSETGGSIYPLIALVGIPIAFLLALALVSFIYQESQTKEAEKNKVQTIQTVKKKRGRPRKYNLIEHSASDLEFKRNYGSNTKE